MSPTIFKSNGYRFFFFSREETRKHVHIFSTDGESKFWLEPEIELAKNYHHSEKKLRKIKKLIKEHYDELINAWEKHFGN